MEIKIYQINSDKDSKRVRFADLESLNREGLTVDPSIYEKVFEGELDTNDLETIFGMLNSPKKTPDGYSGRSMSVSDIVEVCDSPIVVGKVIEENSTITTFTDFLEYTAYIDALREQGRNFTAEDYTGLNKHTVEPGCYYCDSIGFKFLPGLKMPESEPIEEPQYYTKAGHLITETTKVVAIDFDGCLCTYEYPRIGKPIWRVIGAAKEQQENGAILILWTCREGQRLENAVAACKRWGLEFDAVNANHPYRIKLYNSDPRKIGADEYWDDRAVRRTAFPSIVESMNLLNACGLAGMDQQTLYQMLGRLKSDCDYYLGEGHCASRLWGCDVFTHTKLMKAIYQVLPEPPEWLSLNELSTLERKMLAAKEVL